MIYVWLWLIAQLLLLLPNRWTVSLHCRDGSTLSAHQNACVYFAFPASFSRPLKVYTNFTAEVYSYYHYTPAIILYNESSSVPINHGIAATLAYVNRELTNTLVSLVSPRGPTGGRRNTQCVTTAAVSVSDFSPFLLRWAGRGFGDKMQV